MSLEQSLDFNSKGDKSIESSESTLTKTMDRQIKNHLGCINDSLMAGKQSQSEHLRQKLMNYRLKMQLQQKSTQSSLVDARKLLGTTTMNTSHLQTSLMSQVQA